MYHYKFYVYYKDYNPFLVERTDDGELCLMVCSLTVLLSLPSDTLSAIAEEDDNEDVRISNSLPLAIVIVTVLFLEFRRVTGRSLTRGNYLCCHWH